MKSSSIRTAPRPLRRVSNPGGGLYPRLSVGTLRVRIVCRARLMMKESERMAKLTVKDLQQMKANKQKIVAAVVYEAQMTQMMERAGADVLSVGDSLGRAFLAHTEEGAFT